MSSWESGNRYKYPDRSDTRESHFTKIIKYIVGVVFITLFGVAAASFLNQITTSQMENIATDNIQRMERLRANLANQTQQAGVLPKEKNSMERRWVAGKSAQECKNPNGVIDNKTVECMNGHYEYQVVKN